MDKIKIITDGSCDLSHEVLNKFNINVVPLGVSFGEDILRLYGNIDISKAKEYQDVVEQYYPIETIVYGIKNNRPDFIEKGRKEIYIRTRKDEKLRK